MPELPEVEAVCANLRKQVLGSQIEGARVLRCGDPEIATIAATRKIDSIDRKGKHILIRLSGGITLHVHLRMSGNLYAVPDHRFHSHYVRIIIEFTDGQGIALEDPRALARMAARKSEEIDAELNDLGPEPLSAAFSEKWLAAQARVCRQPSKIFLMDQRKVAGVGNIYAAEALHRARVDPRKPMNRLSVAKLKALHGAIVAVFRDAVQSARNAYSGPGEFREAEEFPLAVYDREGRPCSKCGRKIERIAQGGRSTYFCPHCQK